MEYEVGAKLLLVIIVRLIPKVGLIAVMPEFTPHASFLPPHNHRQINPIAHHAAPRLLHCQANERIEGW